MSKRPRTDRRLLGTWQSDREATVAEWRFRKRLTPEKRRRFLDTFGHLTITYTPTRICTIFHDQGDVGSYELLATDPESVAIRHGMLDLDGTHRIQHIHFEGPDRYWIALGPNREWFKRVRPRKRALKRRSV